MEAEVDQGTCMPSAVAESARGVSRPMVEGVMAGGKDKSAFCSSWQVGRRKETTWAVSSQLRIEGAGQLMQCTTEVDLWAVGIEFGG